MSVFLSCFRKKKGDKKSKKNKYAPTSPPPPSVNVEDHSKDDGLKGLNESKTAVQNNDTLGDFSAVGETEVLKSYRKAPPPQNRARQSKAPKALLKSSTENLDLFSERNNELFGSREDMATANTTDDDIDTEKLNHSDDGANDMKKNDDDHEKENKDTPQCRSSMLEDINNTLASIHSEDMPPVSTVLPSDIRKSMEDIAKEVQEKKTAEELAAAPSEIRKSMEDNAKAVKEEMNASIAGTVNAGVSKEEEVEEKIKEEVEEKIKEEIDRVLPEVKLDVTETEHVEEVGKILDIPSIDVTEFEDEDKEIEDIHIVEEVEEKRGDVEGAAEKIAARLDNQIEEKSDEVDVQVINGHEDVSLTEEVGRVHVESIAREVKEDAESKVTESLAGIASSAKETNSQDIDDHIEMVTNQQEEEATTVENVQAELEKVPDTKEVKIPPKVSPKPKLKFGNKHFENNTRPPSQKSEPSSPKTMIEEAAEKVELVKPESHQNGERNPEEIIESPPPTPTSPTSPTSPSMKGMSRIPMSKKTSGIPKLAFSSSKSSSASPISSPDAASKEINQAEEIENKVKQEAADLKANHNAPSSPTSPEADGDLNRSTKESSPFNGEHRSSKSKLTKLRYGGRKKSSESKSDESGSERGSRAGSEAKSDDGKKDDAEMEKNSRIPVRGGSKPRSSPPKSLGH